MSGQSPAVAPTKWTEVALGALLDDAEVFVDGDWVESKDQDPNGDVRLIQLADVGDGFFVDKSARFLTQAKAEELRCTFLKPGDILVARMPDPLGRACIFPGDRRAAVTVVDVCIIRPNPRRVDSVWLKHTINSPEFRQRISGFVTGTTRQRISRGNLTKVSVPLPPLPEQRRIAAILNKADALRAKRREAIAKLDQLLQSVFLDMFGDPVTNPKGWRKSNLEDICEAITDCPHSTPNWTDVGIACLRTSNLLKGGWDWADKRFVSEQEYWERSKRSEARPGDIILSREGTVGVAAIVEAEMRVCMGQRLVQVRADLRETCPDFLLQLLLYDLAPERIGRLMVGSTAKHLNVKDLRELKVFVPPLALQNRFAKVSSRLKSEASRMSTSMIRMDALFSGIQHGAFTGDTATA